MKVFYELDLHNFEAWSGGKDTLKDLSYDEISTIESSLEDIFGDEYIDETAINDFLWFERDTIAELLGYKDEECMWRVKEYGDEVTVKIHDIEWDIDEEDEDIPELKTEITETFDYNGDNDDLEETISDWLSEEFEYCVNEFKFEIEK